MSKYKAKIKHTVICDNDKCKKEFMTIRNARFCSDKCRFLVWDQNHPRTKIARNNETK